jgi:hypothetical protein
LDADGKVDLLIRRQEFVFVNFTEVVLDGFGIPMGGTGGDDELFQWALGLG